MTGRMPFLTCHPTNSVKVPKKIRIHFAGIGKIIVSFFSASNLLAGCRLPTTVTTALHSAVPAVFDATQRYVPVIFVVTPATARVQTSSDWVIFCLNVACNSVSSL